MTWWKWIVLFIIIVSIILLLSNRKLINLSIFKDHLRIYCNYSGNVRKGKISWFDIFSFLILPLVISCSLVWGFDYWLNDESANVILTVTSILFSVLFTVLSIITSKTKSNDYIEKKVIQETFCSITMITLWLIILIILSIVYLLIIHKVESIISFKILTTFIFAILIHSFALLLMTIKRFYLVFSNYSEK